jgi:hypothetical protein
LKIYFAVSLKEKAAKMNKIILVLIFGFFVLDLSAQIKFNDSFEKSTLENQMEIFRDSTNSIIINDVLKNKERLYFVLSTEASPSFGHDSSQRWIHFKITNYASITLPFYIRIYRAYLDKAEFYLCRNDSVLSKVDANWKIPYYKKQISSRSTSAKFLLASNTKYDVYVLVKKTIGTWSFPAELFSQKEYLKMEKLEILSYGILIGGTILICFLSFSLFVLSSETLYLYYLMYAIFSTFSILSFGGILNYFFGNGISIFTGFESQFFYLIGFIITNILFTHKFFQLDTKGPKLLYYLGRVIIFICICYEFMVL